MIRSLRWRLLIGTILVSGIVLTILGVAVDRAVHRTLRDEFDRVLLEKARSLASMVEQSGAETHFDYEQSHFPEFERSPHPAYFLILLNDEPFRRSPSLSADSALSTTGLPRFRAVPTILPDHLAGRILVFPFTPYIEADSAPVAQLPRGTLIVAQNTLSLDRTLDRVRLLLVFLCAAAALLSGIAMLLVVQTAIRPVSRLARDIEKLPDTSLSPPPHIASGDLPGELVPIVDRLNGLLQRLAAAFERERSFTADVAHELRTPLAGLLATLEVARSRPRDAASYEATIDKCLLMLAQMQRLTENLLLLARADSRQLSVRREPLDLASLLQECWLLHEPAARRRNLQPSFHLPDSAPALADPEFLPIILNNLLDNAVAYATDGGRIEARISGGDAGIRLQIANSGHALTHEDLPHLIDRFWRKDRARTGGIHAGLGLSLCSRLASLQGLHLALKIEEELFIASLDLPPAPAAPAALPASLPPAPSPFSS